MSEAMAHILLVDDNFELLGVYGDILRGEGHHVETARDGSHAVERLLDRSRPLPDLVLLDMEMPIMRGTEAAEVIRQHEHLAGLTLVALTSHELPDEVNEALAAGCDAYIVKPTDPEGLLNELALIFAAAG